MNQSLRIKVLIYCIPAFQVFHSENLPHCYSLTNIAATLLRLRARCIIELLIGKVQVVAIGLIIGNRFDGLF
jgi:hypothetical protein